MILAPHMALLDQIAPAPHIALLAVESLDAPQIELAPHMALLPARVELLHTDPAPHIAFLEATVLAPHIALSEKTEDGSNESSTSPLMLS